MKPASSTCNLNALDMKILYYKNENDLPDNVEKQENIRLSGIHFWEKLKRFNKNKYSHFVIIVSNSDGQFHLLNNPSCNIELDIAYAPPVPEPGRNKDIAMQIEGKYLKVDGKFSYQDTSKNNLNIDLKNIEFIGGIGGSLNGKIIAGQAGTPYTRGNCGSNQSSVTAQTKRSGNVSLTLSFPTGKDLSKDKNISGIVVSGSYSAIDNSDYSTRTGGNCANWSSWGYNHCYAVDQISGTAKITYSGGNTATITGKFKGNGKKTSGGYWGCSISDARSNGSSFSISESFSFTIPVTEKQL